MDSTLLKFFPTLLNVMDGVKNVYHLTLFNKDSILYSYFNPHY